MRRARRRPRRAGAAARSRRRARRDAAGLAARRRGRGHVRRVRDAARRLRLARGQPGARVHPPPDRRRARTKQQIKAALVAEYGPARARRARGRRLQPRRLARARRCSCRSRPSASAFAARRWRRQGRADGPAAESEPEALDPDGRPPARRRARRLRPVNGGVDTTVVAAFAVGFVSFISPCVLPLVPGYLSAVSGVSLAEMQQGERRLCARAAAGDRLLPRRSRSSSSRSA